MCHRPRRGGGCLVPIIGINEGCPRQPTHQIRRLHPPPVVVNHLLRGDGRHPHQILDTSSASTAAGGGGRFDSLQQSRKAVAGRRSTSQSPRIRSHGHQRVLPFPVVVVRTGTASTARGSPAAPRAHPFQQPRQLRQPRLPHAAPAPRLRSVPFLRVSHPRLLRLGLHATVRLVGELGAHFAFQSASIGGRHGEGHDFGSGVAFAGSVGCSGGIVAGCVDRARLGTRVVGGRAEGSRAIVVFEGGAEGALGGGLPRISVFAASSTGAAIVGRWAVLPVQSAEPALNGGLDDALFVLFPLDDVTIVHQPLDSHGHLGIIAKRTGRASILLRLDLEVALGAYRCIAAFGNIAFGIVHEAYWALAIRFRKSGIGTFQACG
mmetsp:Transcript_22369/g.48472  ORF Transcript_22369/g.48472 Transcript_22369/m.48472 type:complete len:377 (+) Transcript_22369:1096-2226(+)